VSSPTSGGSIMRPELLHKVVTMNGIGTSFSSRRLLMDCAFIPIDFPRSFEMIGGSLMEGMEQGCLQWSYGFLEGA